MLPCYKCAYKDEVPGSAHLRCRFAWEKHDSATHPRPVGNGELGPLLSKAVLRVGKPCGGKKDFRVPPDPSGKIRDVPTHVPTNGEANG